LKRIRHRTSRWGLAEGDDLRAVRQTGVVAESHVYLITKRYGNRELPLRGAIEIKTAPVIVVGRDQSEIHGLAFGGNPGGRRGLMAGGMGRRVGADRTEKDSRR